MSATDPSGCTPEDVLEELKKAIQRNDVESFNQHLAALERLLQDDSTVGERLNTSGALYYATVVGSLPMMDTLIQKGAAKSGNVDTVRLLIDKGADVNMNADGDTPLHLAAKSGNVDTVRFLIDKGADVNIKRLDRSTPLHVAAERGIVDTVRLLIDKGADVNNEGNLGNTPLHEAAKRGKFDVVRFLIDKGADVNNKEYFWNTPLHVAAVRGNVETVILLIDKGADVNIKGHFGNTPLHFAAKEGSNDVVRYLVDKGADVNIINRRGTTPLHMANKWHHKDIEKYLVDHGADVNMKDGEDVLKELMDAIQRNDVESFNQHLAELERLLQDGSAVGERLNASSALYYAAEVGSLPVMDTLIQKGADVNTRSYILGTETAPLLKAAESGNVDSVRLLIDKGADVNIKGSLGNTPLHLAGSHDVVRYLVDKGAYVNIRNVWNTTPLQMANNRHHRDIEKYLLRHGVDVIMKDGDEESYEEWDEEWDEEMDEELDKESDEELDEKSEEQLDEESNIHFEEAMKKGYVECTMTTCAVTGAAGSGKTCTMYLVLNEDPPDVYQSTGLVEPVRAVSTVVGAGSSESGSLKFIRIDEDKLLDRVARAISVNNAEEQPTVQTSPSPPTHSTSLPEAIPHIMRTQKPLPEAIPQIMYAQKQLRSSSEAEISGQVSKSELAFHTEIIDKQLIKLAGLLKKPVGRGRVTKLDFLYFLDSGGQPQFHELLPCFVPNLSTILFVLKLSEKLHQCPVIEYYQEGKSMCSYQSPHSHEQILKHCIRSLQPENRSIEGVSSSSPQVAVVGTHRDLESQCEGETREQKNQKLIELLQPRFGGSLIFYDKLKELIYPVNAKNPSQEDKAVAGKLMEKIVRSSASKQVQIPLPWFILEQVLRKLAKKRGTGVMHIDECRKIASRLHINSGAFNAALKYLVSLNIFLYYSTVLPDVVICVPQVFLDKINELVQWRHILCERSGILPESVTNTIGLSGKQWICFQNHGVFQEQFLREEVFSRHYDKDLFTPADFLKLLESLLIVGKVNTTDEYVMPSLLFELESDKLDKHRCNPQTSPAAPLLVHFPGEWPTSGVFCSLVASLLSTQNWKVMIDAKNKPTCLYRNCFQFEHPRMPGSITLIDSFHQSYFEVHVDDNAPLDECTKYCPEIRKSVFAALPPKAPALAEVAFFCPNSKGSMYCPSSLHLAYMKPSNHWSCSENPGKVYGSLAEAPNMTVWGITKTPVSGEREHGCQQSEIVSPKLANRPEVYQLMKLKGKGGRTLKVIEGVAAEWERLAYTLQFSPAVVRIIRRDTTQDCTAACEEVLYRWVNGTEGTRQPVSWATLIECLRDCDFIVLARDLEKVLCEH